MLFSETTADYELTEGDNTLAETITPTAFMHFYSVEGNVPEASVSISTGGNQVFTGGLDEHGVFTTDSAYLDSREKQMDLHVEAPGYETLDSAFVGNWSGQDVNFTLQEEDTPIETFNHTVMGSVMDGAYITIWDAQADTMLTDTEEVDGSYTADFTNTNESQGVRITQSAPNVVQKSWTGTVTDTLRQDLTDVIGQYQISGTGGPEGAWVKVYDAQSGTGIDSAQVDGEEYSLSFESEILDSVRVVEEKENYQALDTIVDQLALGANTVNLASLKPDTVSYRFFGSAGTDSTSYVIVNTADTSETLGSGMALQANDPDYEESVKRLATENPLDSVTYRLTREGYADTDTTVEVSAGENRVDIPSLEKLEEPPEHVLNESVWGDIVREKENGGSNVIKDAFIKLEGININYDDSLTMSNSTYSYYEFTDLHIPVDGQGNPDTAQYIRTITPTDTTSTSMFKPYKDTVKITKDMSQFETVTVQQLDQDVTLVGTIRDIYDADKMLDSAKVRFKRVSDSTLITEAVTESDGKYRLPDIECGTEGFFEVGYYDHNASGYLSRVGDQYRIKSEVVHPSDSVTTINWMMVPDSLIVPTTAYEQDKKVEAVPSYIAEMVTNTTNTEAARGRQIKINLSSMPASDTTWFKNRAVEIDSLFHGISTSVPINDPKRTYKFVNRSLDGEAPYDPYSESQENTGYNAIEGATSSYGTIPVDNRKQYDESAVCGGDVAYGDGNTVTAIKEEKGRVFDYGNVTSRPDSYMTMTSSYPTLQDRAISYVIDVNDKARWSDNPTDYYKLENVVYSISGSNK